MNKIVSISTAAKALGVSTSTLRRWEASGRLVPGRTEGGQRRYDLAALRPGFHHGAPARRQTVAYARVSSHDQQADLERQRQVLELYCASQGWTFEIVADLGSGMNYHKKGLKRLLDAILEGESGNTRHANFIRTCRSRTKRHCGASSTPSSGRSFRGCWT